MVRTVQTIAFLTLTVVVAWFLRGTILLVVAGSLFGIALRAASVAVARVTRIPVVAAVWALVVVTVSLLLASAVLGGSAFVAQWAELWQTLHSSLNAALRELPRVPAVASALAAIDLNGMFSQAGALLAGAGGILSGAMGLVLAVVIIVFVAVAGALEPQLYRDGFIRLFSPPLRDRARSTIDEIVQTLQTWLFARLISMFVTGILVAVGLSVLRIPLAGALGVLAGALAFIPNIGAFIAGAPAVIIAFAMNPRLAAAVLVMYWMVHFVDDFLLSPFIERKMVRLPPILTLVMQIALALAAGTIGVMLAAPVVVIAMILVQRLWIDRLERSV